MSWPLASHFSAVLQNPRVAFRDPALQSCTIEMDERRQPRPWAGAFAVVYKGVGESGEPFAVRVFTTESPERRERYDRISEYLKTRKLKCLVDFEYHDASIRSAGDGKWYPVIVMDWVRGETLFTWVRQRCLEQDRTALAHIAGRWLATVDELATAGVAHGDLQHANVMVTDRGEIRLVDYDCMCVPELVGRRNLETGVEPYQHPHRDERTLLSHDLDRFSALTIYTALRALATDPTRWHRYVEATGYDKLLFRTEDFQNPAASALYHELSQAPEDDLRQAVEHLFASYRSPIDQVRVLSEVANPYARIEQLLQAERWSEAVQMLNQRGQFRDAPERLKPAINRAYEEDGRRRSWAEFAKLPTEASEANDRALVGGWNESLFTGYEPAERLRVRVAEARRRVTLLDRLRHLVQQTGGELILAAEKGVVEIARKLPRGYQHQFRPRVEQSQGRYDALLRMEKALKADRSEASIIAAWRTADAAGVGPLLPDSWRERIELAERREPLLKELRDLPEGLAGEALERRLAEIWQDDLLADCREAERWRDAQQAASSRDEALNRLKTAVAARNLPEITCVLDDPALKEIVLPDELKVAVETIRRDAEQIDSLLSALAEERRDAFVAQFDAARIRDEATRFAECRERLLAWTTEEAIGAGRAAPTPQRRRSVRPEKGEENVWRIQFQWPEPRWADRCLLAVCRTAPAADADPESVAASCRIALDWRTWEKDGRRRLLSIDPDWLGATVVVWPIVDLGFERLTGPPVVLGALDETGKSWNPLRVFGSREAAAGEPSAGDA